MWNIEKKERKEIENEIKPLFKYKERQTIRKLVERKKLIGWFCFMAYQPLLVIQCQILFTHIY